MSHITVEPTGRRTRRRAHRKDHPTISEVLRDFARALRNVEVGSTAVDEGADFFGGLLYQAARFISTAFGS
ncbi:MAG: hypothetical protein ACI39C_02520 [Dietzia sp.]